MACFNGAQGPEVKGSESTSKMPEPGGLAQSRQVPGSASESHVKDEGTEASTSELKAAAAAESAKTAAAKARRRTKTGCLTCRKRRIKCGEERPTCKNCVKSKRECEGYIPRVIFKDPLGAFRPGHQGIAVRAPYGSGHNGTTSMYGGMPPGSAETPIAPRLPVYAEQPSYGQSAAGNYYGVTGSTHGTQYYHPNGAPTQQYTARGLVPNASSQSSFTGNSIPNPQTSIPSYSIIKQEGPIGSGGSIEEGRHDLSYEWPQGLDVSNTQQTEYPVTYANSLNLSVPDQSLQNPVWLEPLENQYAPRDHVQPSHESQIYPLMTDDGNQDLANLQTGHLYQFNGVPPHLSWVEEPEDDYFDVDSEDDGHDMKLPVAGPLSYNLGPLIAMSANHSNGGIRSMTNFLNEPNVLATYHPSWAASPLMDPQTARVFCHFITATAPTLAVCERRPSNPAVIFSGAPVPKSQRSLWSYTLPMLALSHQGLLHAMLAMASLHISKLQHTSTTPSLKHYHYALRRVAKALGNQKKRKDVATLAATLLLGFYEVTTAEHNKWNSHLSGARELVVDIAFAGMAKKIEAQRRRQEEAEARTRYQNPSDHSHGYYQALARRASDDFPAREDRQLNENLISTLIGWKTNYDRYGHVIGEDESRSSSDSPLTPQDVENFEIQCDLFWWYAKQDVYQSIISGNPLLLSYDRWSLCPPRAPIGRLDAVYGTLDHLLLLMGRLANFASKDLPRKLRAQREADKKAQQHAVSTGTQATQPSFQRGAHTMPNGMSARPMYGMIPDPGPIRVPNGFDQAQHDRIYTAPVPSQDKALDTATHEAETEWTSISRAFDVFAESLGPAYAPLEPEHMTPMATPFGPALYYRSYSIACIHTMYYCGRIVCMRVKPSMPPAAMVAAGIAAQSTANWANTLGRVVAGVQPIDSSVPINPHHGAALMDCCFPLFQAGVQFRHPGQRGWTITKLRDVARLTGWQTSTLIAKGCERAWMRAAEQGKGPPWVATMDENDKDDRLAGRGRDPRKFEEAAKDNTDRRFITVNPGTRVYWALGILGVEEDMKGMKLD